MDQNWDVGMEVEQQGIHREDHMGMDLKDCNCCYPFD